MALCASVSHARSHAGSKYLAVVMDMELASDAEEKTPQRGRAQAPLLPTAILLNPLIVGALPLHNCFVALRAGVVQGLVGVVPPRTLARSKLTAIVPSHPSNPDLLAPPLCCRGRPGLL